MGSIFRVAKREYLSYVLTRGFLLSLIMLPLLFALGAAAPALLQGTAPVRHYVVVDQSERFAEVIRDEIMSDHRRSVVNAWDAYVTALVPDAEARDSIPAPFGPAETTDARVERFYDAGGPEAAQAALEEAAAAEPAIDLPDVLPDFPAPKSRLKQVPPPPGIDIDAPLERVAEALRPYLVGDRMLEVDGREVPLFAAVLIPAELGADPASDAEVPMVQYWSDNLADTGLRSRIDDILGRQVRLLALQELGLDARTVGEIRALEADVQAFLPERLTDTVAGEEADLAEAEAGATDFIATWLPAGLTYILFIAIFSVSSSLLTSTIEEKSNRIAELLVSSVRPHELMMGKLIGVASVGLTTVGIYGGLALIGLIVLGSQFDFGTSPLGLLFDSGLLPLFIFYFIVGYVMLASIYLAVGSLCQSLQEAQTYIGPLTLISVLPLFMLVAVQQDPNGVVARVMTWIPLYTPYAMMLRAPHDPPLWEFIGATVMLVVFAGFTVWLMGRIFRNSILNTGQPPKMGELMRLMRRREM